MMICHFIIVLSCSSIVVLGVELSCNQSNTTCPGDVVQCECQVSSDNSVLQWLARDLLSEEDVLIETYRFNSVTGVPRLSGAYSTVLCSAITSESSSLVTLTSKLTVTLANTIDVTCRRASGTINNNTTRLTVASKLNTINNYLAL